MSTKLDIGTITPVSSQKNTRSFLFKSMALTKNNNSPQEISFSAQEIDLNRAGLLSKQQQNSLEIKYRKKGSMFFKGFIFSLLCTLFILILVLNPRGAHEPPLSPEFQILAWGLLSLPSIFFLLAYLLILKRKKIFSKGKIKIKSHWGKAQLIQRSMDLKSSLVMKLIGGENTFNIIKIDGKSFWVDQRTLATFSTGKKYIIYYLSFFGEAEIISAQELL